jgi:hypothetical protein
MAMQIMIDHDLGYTLDAAKGSFDAAKDHPLASAAYLEKGGQNSSIFSLEEQAYMQKAVLKHSYPFGLDQPLDFSSEAAKRQSIQGIISVVDAMGVTADTKCPALFREVLNIDALGMLADGDTPALKKFLHSVIDEELAKRKISEDVAKGYHWALEYDVNAFGAKGITAQFGGQLLKSRMEPTDSNEDPPKHFALHIDFGVSERIKTLADVFGNADDQERFNKAAGAFDKVAKDLFSNMRASREGKAPNLGKAAQAIEWSSASDARQTFSRGGLKLTLRKLQE